MKSTRSAGKPSCRPASLVAGAAVALALLVLLGWAADLPWLTSVSPNWRAMQPLTAAAFLLAGLALYCFAARRWRALPWLLLPLIAIPASALFQHWSGRSLGIDTLLFPAGVLDQAPIRYPGRMAEITAIEFLFFALFLAWPRRTPRQYRAASRIATLGLLIGLVGLAGYFLGVHDLARVGSYTAMAAHTALGFVLLFTGALLAQRDPNWLHLLLYPSMGGRLARRLLYHIVGWSLALGLTIPIVAPLIGNPRLEIAIYAVALAVVLVAVVLRFAKRLKHSEAQRNRAMAAVATTRAQLAGVLESALDAVITIDEAQRIVFFNPAAEKVFGCAAAKAVGASIERFIPERFRTAHAEHVRRFGQTGETSRPMGRPSSLRALRSDGTEFPVEASISQVRVGTRKYLTIILRDITERKHAEERLRESEQYLRHLIDTLPGMVWTTTGDGAVDFVSQQWLDYTGTTLASQLGNGFLASVHPGDRENLAGLWQDCLARQAAFHTEYRLRRHDGTYRWFGSRGTPIRDPEGRVVRWLGVITDIDDLKRTEEALRQERSRLQAILDNSPVLISVRDTQSRMVLANQAIFETLDVPPAEEFIGRSIFESLPRQVAEALWANDLAAIEKDAPLQAEETVQHRDGTWHTYLATKFPVHDIGTHELLGICAISTDITDRRAAEAEIRRLNAELERRVDERTLELERSNEALLHSNMELQNFAHATAHDLQTPLRSIAGFAQLLHKELGEKDGGYVRELLDLIVGNAKRLQALIESLLAYTRLDAQGLPFEAVDLRDVADEVVASLAVLIQETGVEIRCEHLPTVWVDRIQIIQLFRNLIENAIKYNRSKPPRIAVASDFQDDEWVFSVTDNGIGIDPKHHERIFEIFRRLHTYSQVPGTGIGLALCRRIVERHGGHIWVESRPGEGSTFYFTLPAGSGR